MILIEKEIIPEEVLADPDAWQQIGEEHHDEFDVTKSQMFWRRIVRKKFVHKTEKALPPLIAPAPLPSIPGTLIAPAFAAQIIADKYQDHLAPIDQAIREEILQADELQIDENPHRLSPARPRLHP